MANARILVMVKPGGMARLDTVEQFLNANGRIVKKQKVLVDVWRIGQHYKQFRDKPFYLSLLKYFKGKEVMAYIYIIDGSKVGGADPNDTIAKFREMIGAAQSNSGFRRQLMTGPNGEDVQAQIKAKEGVVDNGIHTSDSVQEAEREIRLWFGTPQLADIGEEPGRQTDMRRTHRAIYNALSGPVRQQGGYMQFAGGTHNGLAVPGSDVDFDYRIMVPTDDLASIEQFAKTVATAFMQDQNIQRSGLKIRWDKQGVDEKTKAGYVKYEIDFPNMPGKADVAFVPSSQYRGKVSSAHLATLMDPQFIQQARQRKAATKSDKEVYKKTKRQIAGEIDARFPNLEWHKFSEWVRLREARS